MVGKQSFRRCDERCINAGARPGRAHLFSISGQGRIGFNSLLDLFFCGDLEESKANDGRHDGVELLVTREILQFHHEVQNLKAPVLCWDEIRSESDLQETTFLTMINDSLDAIYIVLSEYFQGWKVSAVRLKPPKVQVLRRGLTTPSP